VKVLEVSNGAAGACAGLLLAELGFDVDHLPAPPMAAQIDQEDADAFELFFHRGKTSVDVDTIDLTQYDALVEDCGATTLENLGLNLDAARAKHGRLAIVSLSEFGLSGPYSTWTATDINAQAAGGIVHVSGFSDETPRKLPGDAAMMIAGLHGATAVVSAVLGIQRGVDTGVHVDISAQDTFMQHWTRHVSDYAYSGTRLNRQPREPRGIHFRHTARARDGWIFMLALRQPWQDVAAFLGLGEYLSPDLMDPDAEQPWEEMADAFTDAVATKDRYDWFADAADLGWTFAPVEDPWAVAHGPQTEARGSMHEITVDGRTIHVPGLPFRYDDDPSTE
jgi:crotonobetainyl-CoA:carnitine CoA-transferase CaiB-like acyl-CoA transferase